MVRDPVDSIEDATATGRGRAKVFLTVLVILLGSGGVVGAWPVISDVLGISNGQQSAPPSVSCCAPSATTPAPVVLRFVRPSGTIPLCNDFGGTGRIPDGFSLLIFDKSQTDANASYWFNKPAEPTDAGWIARSVQIGEGNDRGKKVEILAVLVPEEMAAYIASIETDSFWWAKRLPAAPVDRMTVERSADRTPCA